MDDDFYDEMLILTVPMIDEDRGDEDLVITYGEFGVAGSFCDEEDNIVTGDGSINHIEFMTLFVTYHKVKRKLDA